MQYRSNKQAFKVSVMGLALACLVTACDKSKNNTGVSGAGAVQTAAVVPELKEMRHRASECPRAISGSWATTNPNNAVITRSYNFEGRTLVEQSSDRMVFDGQIHQLPEKDGLRLWYVGACRNRTLQVRSWATNGTQVVKIDGVVVSRRGRLAVGSELNGYKIPFMQIYDRTD